MKTRLLLTGFLALLLSGCFGGSRPPSYYLLTARATAAATPIETTLGVGPVRVAPFLMRQQITTHAGGGELALNDDRRWSEPLEQGIQRVLLQNLSALTGADMRNFPWTVNTAPRYALRVDVIDLDRHANDVVLEVHWILEDIAQGKLLASHRDRFTTAAAADDDYAALAASYSTLLAEFAQKAAAELATQATRQ